MLFGCQTAGASASPPAAAPISPAADVAPGPPRAETSSEPVAAPPPQSAGGTLPPPGPNAAEALPEWVGPLWGRFQEGRFYSAALDREMPYYIYLPPGHGEGRRAFPVLYMLHGAAGDNAEWATIKLIDWADRLIVAREVPPFILVLPQGDFGYWVNHVNDGPRWGDYVVEDLPGYVERTYGGIPRPQARAVGGNSQGGHAALRLVFSHPEVFGVAGAHSPSLREEDGVVPWLGSGAEWAQRDPLFLAQTLPVARLQQATLWLDVGTEDQWRPRVELLHQTLLARGVRHEWRSGPGRHDGDYWLPNVPNYLRYYGRALGAALDTAS
jgi:enterochelin esterase-like enzyme